MKKHIFRYLVLLIGVSFVFAACQNRNSKDRQVLLITDSATFNNSTASDTATVLQNTSADKRMTVTPAPSTSANAAAKAPKKAYQSGSNESNQGAAGKKGWSKAAQGAVIGGATGAVGGAIISKNKGAGAAIGAAVGAAGGYIIGNEKDKKDGRKKKKDQ